VRTGEPIESVAAGSAGRSPLVVLIAWKGLGTPDLEEAADAWPFLRAQLRRGSGTLEATTGSLPLDPAATLTSIGSGGLPSAHGITGATLRDDGGEVRPAWSAPGTGSVIATFADDLDHDSAGGAEVGAVLAARTDRGIVGDGWYLEHVDRDPVVVAAGGPREAVEEAEAIVRSRRMGSDGVTDVLAIVLDGRVDAVDAATAELVTAIRASVPRTTFALAGTGSLRPTTRSIDATMLASEVDAVLGAAVVEEPSGEGLFLDRDVLVADRLTAQQVADVLGRHRMESGAPLFADVSPSFVVAFSRYC
jgi:hypothetical protein